MYERAVNLPVRMPPSTIPLTLLIVVSITSLYAQSPPGKPKITHCLSYDKETATCWWEPGSNGGLPTKYTFLYWTEKNKTHRECSDYETSGKNSCFFDKDHSSLWMYYHTYVTATNALGSTKSDHHLFELEKIVKTFPPRNLSLTYETNKTKVPYLLVSWMPPQKVDVKIGWVTLQYEVRLIEEKKQKPESHVVDYQTKLKVFSLTPGEDYVVQVRCKADGSDLWSDWSDASYIHIPESERKRDLTLWISIAVLSVIICLTMIWTMALKGCSWMACICPPVPGPKIMGFDTQLLKNGKSEDLLSAFGCQGFPPTSDCEDLLVEFLEVDDSKELISSSERDLQSHHIEVSPVDTDNDSGRGSCDSHFAPSEGSKDHRVLPQAYESTENTTHNLFMTKCPWPLQNPLMEASFSNFNDKSYIWSDGMVANNPSPKSSYHNITDVCKMALGTMNANMSGFFMPNEERTQHSYFRTIETISKEGLNKQNDLGENHSKGVDSEMLLLLANEKTSFNPPRAMDYVEVHDVNQNDALALIPKHKETSIKTDQYSALAASREYSKVERVEGDNVLVLMPNLEVQLSPSDGDTVMELVQKPQSSQAEKLMGFIRSAQNEGNPHTAGMGYMDPSMFLP